MGKKLILLLIVVGLIIFGIYQGFLKEEKSQYSLVEVKRGDLFQEVSETGQVQIGEKIDLGFKNAGTIERIYVKVGDEIWPGSNLAKLDASQFIIERSEAQAALGVAQAKLEQLLAGSSQEEIQLYQTAIDNSQQNLIDVQSKAQEDLNQAYQDALNVLDGSYLKGSDCLTTVTLIQRTYFEGGDQESITARNEKEKIEDSLAEAKEYINIAKTDSSQGNIDKAIPQLKDALNTVYDSIIVIRDITEISNYRDIVSDSDKTDLDTEKTNINTAITNITNAKQTIASTKITNEKNINEAEGKVKKAEDELALKKAEPRQADIDLYQAQVKQAQAKVDLLENQIWETTLRSPIQGMVIEINKEVGETCQPTLADTIITLLPASPYEIGADIYEEDIVKMDVGDSVDIELIAFPDQIFKGEVISVDPAEKLVEGVVYYEVRVSFKETPSGIKPGMTADIIIKTDSRENVLVIPEEAIQKKDGKDIVQVFKNDQIEDREIEIGLKSSDDIIEIVSGLTEGENLIIPE